MEFVTNEVLVSRETSEHLKPLNVNRFSSDSGVVDIDLRPLEIAEIRRLSGVGNGRVRPRSVHSSLAGVYFSVRHSTEYVTGIMK